MGDGRTDTIAGVLDRGLTADPDREVVVARSGRLTYRELDRLADRAAHAFAALGIVPGDRVAASLPTDLDIVVAFHGAMRLGAVWVGVNQALAPPEARWQLADCGASLLLAAEPLDHAGVTVLDLATWRAALDAADDRPVGVEIDPFAPAGVAYTSGTTGRPKGAVHSQHNLLLPAASLVEERAYGPELRKGDCFALTILNMHVLTTLLVAQAGGTSIVMDRTDAVGVAGWIRDERVTLWNGAPAMLHSLAHSDDVVPEDLASLEEVWTGGADCPEAIREAFTAKFGLPVAATYGLTEAPCVVAIDGNGGRDHVAGASGRPLRHLALRITGEGGETLPAGEVGEICLSGSDERYQPMLGYWNRSDVTADTVSAGELRTGDLGLLDADGCLHVRERKSLVILRGGANVYPAEVERVLHEHPAITSGAVFGVPDERLGERVVAVVQATPGTDLDVEELRAFLLANLARYKVPERITVVDDLPRNTMGKIVRTELPELFAASGLT